MLNLAGIYFGEEHKETKFIDVSRVTKYLLDRGATATVTLTSEHYRRSPLVQGGLEIPCKVSVTMPGTVNNLLVMEKYRQLVEELYSEPKNEEILGSFLHIDIDLRPVPAEKKVKSKKTIQANDNVTNVAKQRDIRSFFGNESTHEERCVTKKSKRVEIISID